MKLEFGNLAISLLFFIFLFSTFVSAEECKQDLSVYVQFKALDGDNPTKISNHQNPNYKEDDLLSLWRILVVNKGTCQIPKSIIKINITTEKETINHLFCAYQLEIPQISPNSSYYIIPNGIEKIDLEGQIFERPLHTDSLGKNITFCRIGMLTTGLWKTQIFLEPYNNYEHIGSWGTSMINDGNRISNLEFKVRPKQEVIAFDYQKEYNKTSIFVVVLIGIFTILVQFLLFVWEIKEEKKFKLGQQRELINSLSTQLGIILSDVKGHKTELKKKKAVIPSYFIYKFNASHYLTLLWEEIKRIKTKKLKESLVKLEQKVDNINRLIELLQKADIENRKEPLKDLLKEVKSSNFKYHSHAEKIIEELNKEIDKLKL
ncbi:MAG: hypothetical protein Q7S27_00685 [Nanoarchaeota archaeon]|nr:hypothetical protein [Nanoarchaeota archaeon]